MQHKQTEVCKMSLHPKDFGRLQDLSLLGEKGLYVALWERVRMLTLWTGNENRALANNVNLV